MSRNSRAPRRAQGGRSGSPRERPAADARVPVDAARAAMDDHVIRLRAALAAVDIADVIAAAERVWHTARAGGLVLIAGNGGSAANAAHMAVDLGKSSLGRPPRPGAVRVRSVALSDAASVLTAWGNDEAFDRVFAEQIATLAREGDAVLLLSASGRSPNIVAAARAARSARAAVISLLGGDGGAVRALSDHAIVVPSDDYQVVEDAHLAVNHMITTYIRLAVGAKAPRLTVGTALPPRGPHAAAAPRSRR